MRGKSRIGTSRTQRSSGRGTFSRFISTFLLSSALLAMLMGAVFYVQYLNNRSDLVDQEEIAGRRLQSAIERDLRLLATDLDSFASRRDLRLLLATGEVVDQRGLSSELKSFFDSRQVFKRLYLTDSWGRDLLAVEHLNGTTTVTLTDTLSWRDDSIANTLRELSPGERYFWHETSGSGSPEICCGGEILDRQGKGLGTIILVHDATRIFSTLLDAVEQSPGQWAFLDPRKRTIFSSSAGRIPATSGSDYFKSIADSWSSFDGVAGHTRHSSGLLTWRTVYPERLTAGGEEIHEGAARQGWKIVSLVPAAVLIDRLKADLLLPLQYYLVALIFIFVGSVLLATGSVRRRKSEISSNEEQDRVADILRGTNDLIFTLEVPRGEPAESSLLSINRAASKLLGRNPTEVTSLTLQRVVATEDLNRVTRLIRNAMSGRDSGTTELTLIGSDGRRIFSQVAVTPVHEGDNLTGIQFMARDLTEQRAAQSRVREIDEALKVRGSALEAGAGDGTLENRLNSAVEAMASNLGGKINAVSLYLLENNRLKLTALMGNEVKRLAQGGTEFALDETSVPGRVAKGRSPLQYECADFSVCAEKKGDETTYCYRGWPLESTGEVKGVLLVETPAGTEWPELRQQSLAQVSLILAAIIHRDELVKVSSKSSDELKKLQGKSSSDNDDRVKFIEKVCRSIHGPTSSILGMADLALDSDLGAREQEMLLSIKQAASSQQGVITNILDYTTSETRTLRLDKTDFQLRQLLQESINVVAGSAQAGDVEIGAEIEKGIPSTLVGDAKRLRQIIDNLLENAFKFTETGEVILKVELTRREEESVQLHISVRDSGIGIQEDELEMIFDPFYQVPGSINRRVGGSGLGLTIAERLVSLMEGRIWVQSLAGIGSTFHFTVTLGIAAGEIVPRQDSQVETSYQSVANSPVGTPGTASLNILLAEDNESSQQHAVKLLKERGHRVTLVPTGIKAIEFIAQVDFDLVLMDTEMPELDGLAATKAVRDFEKGAGGHVPIIALSSHAMKDDLQRCLAAGMDRYLTKPIQGEELDTMLAELIETKQLNSV